MVGKTALNKERYHLNGGPFQTFKALELLLDCIIGSCKQER